MALNFPDSPISGDIYTSGGLTYQYNGTVWVSVNVKTNNAYNVANTAFLKANQVGEAVTTANGNITAAFLQANAALYVANTSNGNIIAAFLQANAGLYVSNTQNTNITAAFLQANAGLYVSNTQNTNITAAFLKANQVGEAVTTANGNITAAFLKANQVGAAVTTANSNITAAFLQANAALYVANTSNGNITAAFLQANSALYVANTSNGNITAAFLKANQVGAAVDTANTNMVMKTGNTMTGNLVMSGANIAFTSAANTGIYWGANSFIYSTTSNTLVFGTSLTEDVRIDPTGYVNVAIGLYVTGTFSDAKANNDSQTLTDGVTINWDASLGRVATVTLAGNRALINATNMRVGTYILHVIQDGVGGRTLNFQRGYKFTANVAPTLSTAAGARDVFSFVSDGTNMYGAMIPDVRS